MNFHVVRHDLSRALTQDGLEDRALAVVAEQRPLDRVLKQVRIQMNSRRAKAPIYLEVVRHD